MSRLGGDEYAVVIYNTPLDRIDHALQTIVSSINEYPFLHEDKTFHLSTSCGGCYVNEKLLKDSKELISKKTITSDNFTQHLRHESTKVLIDVKRAGRNSKQIKVLP
jgi:GGDEF domain-containing protein